MTTFQIVLIAQIIFSSAMTVWSRHTALTAKKYALTVGIIMYACIASMGVILSFLMNKSLPSLPGGAVWLYLIIEGVMIPLSWIMQFKIISYIGAGNTVITNTFNLLGAATLGIIFLGESVTVTILLGSVLLLAAIYIVLGINPDNTHYKNVTKQKILGLILVSFISFTIGIFFEKKAINAIGVSDYIVYGWTLQLVGAYTWYKLFSNQKFSNTPANVKKNAVILGVLTSFAGLLFVIALSLGTLSQTAIATSAKIIITSILAAVFLNERNDIFIRLIAFMMAITGIVLILI